jgi:hypothetical protein
MYYGEFNCREDVLREFYIKSFDGAVIHAQYDLDGYEGSAYVIFLSKGMFYLVNSSHCSCNGLEWEPEEMTAEVLAHIIREGNVYGLQDKRLAQAIEQIGDLVNEDSSEEQITMWMRMLM